MRNAFEGVLCLLLAASATAQEFALRSQRPLLGYTRLGPGGVDGGPVLAYEDRLWDFDGTGFAPGPSLPLSSVAGTHFCYDRGRREGLMVRRPTSGTPRTETWVRTSAGFALRALGPLHLDYSLFAYDPNRQGIVAIYSGLLGPPVAEYLWDGTSWTTLPAPPAARGLVLAVAPDLVRSRLVAVCTTAASGLEMWEHDGTAWSMVPMTTVPPFRSAPGLAWDALTSRVLMFGDISGALADTWLWDGVDWTAVPTPTTPTATSPVRLMYDPIHDTLRVMTPFPSEWLWTGSDWRAVEPVGPTSIGQGFDPTREQMVRFDDRGSYFGLDRDWRFAATLPPVPWQAERLAYDVLSDSMLLYHFPFTASPTPQTWTLADNGTWTLQPTTSQPAPRTGYALLSSPLTAEVVLFGGSVTAGLLGDTWVWTGQWTERTSTLSPAPPPSRAVAGNGPLSRQPFAVAAGALWEWSGSWVPVAPTVPVPFPISATVRADGARVVAGQDIQGNPVASELRGGTWSPLPMPPINVDSLLEDPVRGSLIAFSQGQEYVLTTTPASDVAVGDGCGNPAPRIEGVGRASIANPDYRVQVRTDGGAPMLLAIGGSQVSLPLGGGCTQYVDGVSLALFALADASGRADFGLPIPNAPALRGLLAVAQAVALQAGGPLGGLAVTPGLAITVGD